MVTKKDFKAVADNIASVTLMAAEPNGGTVGTPERRQALRDGADIARNQIARWTADYFATQNPKFDRQKFLNACRL